ncbi:MAG: HEAT repeat domain-containing protein [Candidatus Omnitrophica bacterium]|nr:HEAT repeat domain-containing protein [Candidatus Omnitrophota bacterium]
MVGLRHKIKDDRLGFFALAVFSFLFSISACTPSIPEKYRSMSISELVKCLQSKEGTVRANAIVVLGTRGKDAIPAIPDLIKVLGDNRQYVRNCAMDALAEIGKASVPALVEAVEKDKNKVVRFHAAGALRKIHTKESQAAYEAYFKREGYKYA